MKNIVFTLLAFALSQPVLAAKEIRTNNVTILNAPDWLRQPRVEKVTDRIQNKLEWQTRRVNVKFYSDRSDYEGVHKLGAGAVAVAMFAGGEASVHLGPDVTDKNFDDVFGHEMVHVIVFQKYKDAIPKWLEEGLANHLAKRGNVDYKWLASQPFPDDVREMSHPFKGSAALISYRYMASQAFAEMLQKKCELENLIRLSVQRKMEDYMRTYCEIKDLNAAFRDWVKKKAQ